MISRIHLAILRRGAKLKLDEVAGRAASLREQGQRSRLETLAAALDEAFHGRPYFQVPDTARQAWEASVAGLAPEETALWGGRLLAHLIADAPRRLRDYPTPDSILPHLAAEFSRILSGLAAPRDLNQDLFLKDLAMCRLEAFPCVAQMVDKNSGLSSRKVVAKNLSAALLAMGFRSGFRYAPLFEPHTHTPMMRGFTPAGWEQCYLLVADLLEMYPHHLGFTSTSWFWDPELERVSPGLSFLRNGALGGGAFLLPAGQTEADIKYATANSEVRRRLYEAGEYHPARWMMIWPRAALLDWAKRRRGLH